jgi:hypothetical protein
VKKHLITLKKYPMTPSYGQHLKTKMFTVAKLQDGKLSQYDVICLKAI